MATNANSIELEHIFPNSHSLAADIANKFTSWNGMRSKIRKRWQETIQYVYATSTRETSSAKNEWNHSTHIPKITQIADNLAANYLSALFPHDAWLTFEAMETSAATKEKRRAIEAYLNTKHIGNDFRNVIAQLINDWIIYGNCFAQVYYKNETHVEQDAGIEIQNYVGPVVERISPLDLVFNPLADSFESSPKIRRTVKSLGELHRDVQERPELGYEEDIIRLAHQARSRLGAFSEGDIDKSIQLEFDGFGSAAEYFNSGSVEILEFYGDIYDHHTDTFYKNHVITVVDRTWVIRVQPLKTWTGKPNIFHCGWRLRPDNLWAQGPLDNLIGMQYLIDHLENARADGFDQMLAPTRVIKGDIYENDVQPGKPGGEFISDSGEGDVQNLLPDTTVLTADSQIANKERQMEEYAGAPREAAGFRTPGEKTAFEVQSLQNAASRIFQNKITYFENQFLEKVVNAELETARRNLDESDVIKVIDDDFGAATFPTITREDITAKGKLVPGGASHFARQQQLAQNLIQFSASLASDPLLAQHFPSEKMARAWENILQFRPLEIFEPYGRVAEEAQLARLQQTAAQQLEVEGQTQGFEDGDVDVTDEEIEEVVGGEPEEA